MKVEPIWRDNVLVLLICFSLVISIKNKGINRYAENFYLLVMPISMYARAMSPTVRVISINHHPTKNFCAVKVHNLCTATCLTT